MPPNTTGEIGDLKLQLAELKRRIDALERTLPEEPIDKNSLGCQPIYLSDYERVNIRWLLECCGRGTKEQIVEPFGLVDTGDWLGQLYWKIIQFPMSYGNNMPNQTHEYLRSMVDWWIKHREEGIPK